MADVDYTGNLTLLVNTLAQVESLMHDLEQRKKTKPMCSKQEGVISTL